MIETFQVPRDLPIAFVLAVVRSRIEGEAPGTELGAKFLLFAFKSLEFSLGGITSGQVIQKGLK